MLSWKICFFWVDNWKNFRQCYRGGWTGVHTACSSFNSIHVEWHISEVCFSHASSKHLVTFCKLEYFLVCANISNTDPASSATVPVVKWVSKWGCLGLRQLCVFFGPSARINEKLL